MHIILLQSALPEEDLDQLLEEFPQYLFLTLEGDDYQNLTSDQWSKIEIIYGDRLTLRELSYATQLHWIHSPKTSIENLPMKRIKKQGNILVTNSQDVNIDQVGEFVIGGILLFAKQLLRWRDSSVDPESLSRMMWTLQKRVLLQIGLGRIGSEITKRAKQIGMRTWGIEERKTFHPHCKKIFTYQELHTLLPQADVICCSLPNKLYGKRLLGKEEITLLKRDAILIMLGDKDLIDEEALLMAIKEKPLRGVLLDFKGKFPISHDSSLRTEPNVLITPGVAIHPHPDEDNAPRVFRYNLRQYIYGNFTDMNNTVLG